jgi:uncharacterized membrane protein YheB (UPF0754 family)
MNLENYTAEQLQAELDSVNAQRDALSTRAKELAAAIDQKRTEEAAKAKVASMPDAEKKALAQALGVKSISSGERFGAA